MSLVSTRPNPPTPPVLRMFPNATTGELQAMLRTAKDARQIADTYGYNDADNDLANMISDLHDEQRYRRDLAEHEVGS